jgi:hypothetical protein
MVAKATETLRRMLIYVKAYFVSVHLLLYYVSVNSVRSCVRKHFKVYLQTKERVASVKISYISCCPSGHRSV